MIKTKVFWNYWKRKKVFIIFIICNFIEFLQLKSCALIRLGRFEEALKILDKSDKRISKGYCLLKMNKQQEALSLLGSENLSNDEKLLKAQILFRLEAYSDSLDLYREVEESLEDIPREIVANQWAVAAASGKIDMVRILEDSITFEEIYNYSAWAMARKDWAEAERGLKLAESMF